MLYFHFIHYQFTASFESILCQYVELNHWIFYHSFPSLCLNLLTLTFSKSPSKIHPDPLLFIPLNSYNFHLLFSFFNYLFAHYCNFYFAFQNLNNRCCSVYFYQNIYKTCSFYFLFIVALSYVSFKNLYFSFFFHKVIFEVASCFLIVIKFCNFFKIFNSKIFLIYSNLCFLYC